MMWLKHKCLLICVWDSSMDGLPKIAQVVLLIPMCLWGCNVHIPINTLEWCPSSRWFHDCDIYKWIFFFICLREKIVFIFKRNDMKEDVELLRFIIGYQRWLLNGTNSSSKGMLALNSHLDYDAQRWGFEADMNKKPSELWVGWTYVNLVTLWVSYMWKPSTSIPKDGIWRRHLVCYNKYQWDGNPIPLI